MRIAVFTGPTLSAEDAAKELDAVYLPPASQGDVYAAARERPWAIGIIDGYFERVPAVWHKEILWAMAQGVHVFGSASMGALRAAELATFGMEGVGRVFDAFRSLELEDDDEVAILHGGADVGYRTGSEAMVNIRATLAAAAHCGTIREETRESLIGIAKQTFYPDRSYPSLLLAARARGLPADELDALAVWLPAGRQDQKRSDAIEMLRVMRARREGEPTRKQVRYAFQHTDAWEQVRRQIVGRRPGAGAHADADRDEAVIDELRLEGSSYLAARDEALLHALAQEVGESRQDEVDATLLPQVLEARLAGARVGRALARARRTGRRRLRASASRGASNGPRPGDLRRRARPRTGRGSAHGRSLRVARQPGAREAAHLERARPR